MMLASIRIHYGIKAQTSLRFLLVPLPHTYTGTYTPYRCIHLSASYLSEYFIGSIFPLYSVYDFAKEFDISMGRANYQLKHLNNTKLYSTEF